MESDLRIWTRPAQPSEGKRVHDRPGATNLERCSCLGEDAGRIEQLLRASVSWSLRTDGRLSPTRYYAAVYPASPTAVVVGSQRLRSEGLPLARLPSAWRGIWILDTTRQELSGEP